MTKVLVVMRSWWIALAICSSFSLLCPPPFVGETSGDNPGERLYLQLGQVGLDPQRVYQVREASLERAAIHISLEDGTIAFTEDVMGHITGAFFEGDGEVLLAPPNDVERRSMSLFTGMAILEEHFATAYFRFNDDTVSELQPDLRVAENKQEFMDRWGSSAKTLASTDAMRLLMTFSRDLPTLPGADKQAGSETPGNKKDRFFHARLQGTKLGVFDVSYDSLAGEQIQAGQVKTSKDGISYYDVWTSFAITHPSRVQHEESMAKVSATDEPQDWVAIRRYQIDTEVQPPTQIHAQARVELQVRESGRRTLIFELSRFLQVESVKLNGQSVEFIHNPAMEGTQLSRRGNDAVAVILPVPTSAGQNIELDFSYGGEVLAEAGGGLLYVGARGAWYPNRGMTMADYDLRFEYPKEWTLVATGKSTPVAENSAKGEQVSRWVSERAIPVAGFNLGKYRVATAHAGDVPVETYASLGVEHDFPATAIQVIGPPSPDPNSPTTIAPLSVPYHPSPARNEEVVAQEAAHAIDFYTARFGAYPFSHLALTQIPGRESQGWPGLVFLSSYAFLTQQEREQMHYSQDRILLQELVPAHETAHQWWGDLITWATYRDQWFSEGLANYCALMILQEKNPAEFREVMEKYREELLNPDKDGMAPKDAGPVTLGGRLESSRSPGGYEAISYGRATWLFHMLRTMLDDAEGSRATWKSPADEPFARALRRICQRYAGKSITTRQLLDVFAEDLPPSLRYEKKNSLDWFYDSWINGTSLPKLELKNVRLAAKANEVLVTGTILQKNASDDLITWVPVYAVRGSRQPVYIGRVFADGEESSFHINAPSGTRKILLDPEQTILTGK